MPPRSLLLALTAYVVLVATQLAPAPAHASFSDSDGDGAFDLAEEVFGSDPADAGSVLETRDFLLSPFSVVCTDGLDNDGDGATDAADGGCVDSDGGYPSDETELRLGSDPHDNGSDPEDNRLAVVFAAQGYSYYVLVLCANEQDDDGDGLTDAADPGCATLDADGDGFDDLAEKNGGSDWRDGGSEPEHVGINPASCADAADNDGDGATDVADDGCTAATNDDLADAIIVDSLPFSHTTKLVSPTAEVGEPQPSCSLADDISATVWYRFTPPSDTHVVIETTGSDFISAVSVWHEELFGLTEVACNYSFLYFEAVPSRFAFAAAGGETYSIQVERFVLEEFAAFFPDWGRLRFHMEATSPPVNDDFEDAAAIDSLPFTTSVDTIAASTEPSEPDASCRSQGYPTNSVWYRLTPKADTFVLAEVTAGTDFGVTLGVYEGAAAGALEQVACGDQPAFLARAGHTYYLQGTGYQCRPPAGAEGGIASFCIDSRAGHLALRVDTFDLPSCLPKTFSMTDPRGDADDDNFPLDVTELSVSLGDEFACIAAVIDPPVAARDIGARLELNSELEGRGPDDRSHVFTACDYPTGFDDDRRVFVHPGDKGLLAPVQEFVGNNGGTTRPGYFTYDGAVATLILPLSSIGGDADFRFAIAMSHHWDTYDCVPDGGHIICQGGTCAFSPFRNGDANCGGVADSIDAAIVLQFGAGLLDELACPDAADVTGDGIIDSRDAALILQFGAGLLDRLPPEQQRY